MSPEFIDIKTLNNSTIDSYISPWFIYGSFALLLLTLIVAFLTSNVFSDNKSSNSLRIFLLISMIFLMLATAGSFLKITNKTLEGYHNNPKESPEYFAEGFSKIDDWSEKEYGVKLTHDQALKIFYKEDGSKIMLDNGDVAEVDVVDDRYVRLLNDGGTDKYKKGK